MSGRRKSDVFLADRVRYKFSFFEISVRVRTGSNSLIPSRSVPRLQTGCGRRLAIKLHHSNVQVAIMYSWMNFAVTELRICCHIASSSRTLVDRRNFALNLNGEVSYRELARRPCLIQV